MGERLAPWLGAAFGSVLLGGFMVLVARSMPVKNEHTSEPAPPASRTLSGVWRCWNSTVPSARVMRVTSTGGTWIPRLAKVATRSCWVSASIVRTAG